MNVSLKADLIERDEERARLRADVHAGLAQIDRGEGRTVDASSTETLAAEIKARGRRTLARVGNEHVSARSARGSRSR